MDLPHSGRSPLGALPEAIKTRQFTLDYVEQAFTAARQCGQYAQASLHTQWPGTGFRGDSIFETFIASSHRTISDAILQQTTAQAAMTSLLRQLAKPVILLAHSQGGIIPWLVADTCPGLVRAIVAVEPKGPPFRDFGSSSSGPARSWGLTDVPITYEPPVKNPETELIKIEVASARPDTVDAILQCEPARQLRMLAHIPVLVVTGEASYHAGYDWCTVSYLRQAGVNVTHYLLEERGITGNGHFLFMEKNSDQSAAEILRWITGLENLGLRSRKWYWESLAFNHLLISRLHKYLRFWPK